MNKYLLLYEKYKKKLHIFFLIISIYLIIDITLGTLILKYLDPITFAQQHAPVVLIVFSIIFILIYKVGKKKTH